MNPSTTANDFSSVKEPECSEEFQGRLPVIPEEKTTAGDNNVSPWTTMCAPVAEESSMQATDHTETIILQDHACCSSVSPEVLNVNWNLCVFCQTDKEEKVIDPSHGSKFSKKSGVATGYKNTVENIFKLHALGRLTLPIRKQLLDEGPDMLTTCEANKAVWHRTCRNKIDNQKVERAMKAAQKREHKQEHYKSPVKTRKMSGQSLERTQSCFFCGEDDRSGQLFSARSFSVDKTIREYAEILQDRVLLGKLSEGDMHALDAKYHSKCKLALHNRYRLHLRKQSSSNAPTDRSLEATVLSELVFFIEEERNNSDLSLFKLSELCKMYDNRMLDLDPVYDRKVNPTRLKERLLSQIPDLQAQRQGKEVVLLFDADMSNIVSAATQADDNAVHIARAAQIVRRDILSKEYSFDGTFTSEAAETVVPPSLRAFIGMAMHGGQFEAESAHNGAKLKSVLSVSELMMFNTKKKDVGNKIHSSSKQYHPKPRETPLAIYISLMIYFRTRQRETIDKLSELGLCISYSRMMEIVTQLGNSVSSRFEEEQCVCPPKLNEGLFTVGAVDNLDHNTSSLRSKDSFHGTAISLVQLPTVNNPGKPRETPLIIPRASKKVTLLPAEYTDLPEASLTRDCYAPETVGDLKAQSDALMTSMAKENEWLSNVEALVSKDSFDAEDFISWAAFHASTQQVERPVSKIALLPLFTEKAQSAVMILHAMNLIRVAIQRLNQYGFEMLL